MTTENQASKLISRATTYLMVAGSIAAIALASFLILNVQWFKHSAEPVRDGIKLEVNALNYSALVYNLHLSMIKRSVALFAGFVLVFLGTAVSLVAVDKQISLAGKSGPASLQLATASPGIVAIIVGAFLLAFTINSKDEIRSDFLHVYEQVPQIDTMIQQSDPQAQAAEWYRNRRQSQ